MVNGHHPKELFRCAKSQRRCFEKMLRTFSGWSMARCPIVESLQSAGS